ncbi:MarR family transcriptional regulator [Streptomyces sp. PCS3-D2]|uniref:MarR family winged helix-turn-helix transcriptional regulator n=1 Tax=Streptomyces sp. PCS3-D2 TaxID=1460244 RepID=UPI000447195F|nr:MarR family transcriptional regulator [Streptomyces sp. PCS3-D2]WKV71870.1 MarR family transcriptional regulator [Streptomyces sp. PCS3-D2]
MPPQKPHHTTDGHLDRARELSPALHAMARALRFHMRGSEEVGLQRLPPAEYEVLRTVLDEPGISVGGLARRLGLQTSNVSTTVRGLSGRGLLRREPDPTDRRAVQLHPTDQAMADLRRIEEHWAEIFAGALARLTDDQSAALHAALPALRALGNALNALKEA